MPRKSEQIDQPSNPLLLILIVVGAFMWWTSGDKPGPPVPPEPPQPVPVESYRVIFVKESGATLSPAQTPIPAAQEIRQYLNQNATPENGLAGWREYDPQQVLANEQPVMKSLWEAVQPKLLPPPCLVIEINGKADVMQFPSDVADCMATLKKYKGE